MRTPKMGGKKTTRVFLKANRDVVDSLCSVAEGGTRLTHGLRDLVREKYSGAFDVELAQEPCERSDILLQQLEGRPLPAELDGSGGGPHPLASQFRTRLVEEPADIVVLSLQPEVEHPAWRHREAGYLIAPADGVDGWPPERRRRLSELFTPTGLLTADQSEANLAEAIGILKERCGAHVIVFNTSTIDPDDHIDNYHGREDNRELRSHRLNLALMRLSILDGVSIVDVDRLIAEMGGEQHVRAWGRYSDEAYAAICREFLRVAEDLGFFEERPLVMQLGRRGMAR